MAIEGVNLDYSVVPKEKFNFVLYNPPAADLNLIDDELKHIQKFLDKYIMTIWVEPNEDLGRNTILFFIDKLNLEGYGIFKYKTLPRNQFLALIKESNKVIGNSSSFKLELPFFRSDYIHIGVRNKDRESIEPGIGASDRIVEIVTKWLDEKKE